MIKLIREMVKRAIRFITTILFGVALECIVKSVITIFSKEVKRDSNVCMRTLKIIFKKTRELLIKIALGLMVLTSKTLKLIVKGLDKILKGLYKLKDWIKEKRKKDVMKRAKEAINNFKQTNEEAILEEDINEINDLLNENN